MFATIDRSLVSFSTKYTRSESLDSLKTPGETAATSSRLSICWRNSSDLRTAHGDSANESSPMVSASGNAKTSTGRAHDSRLRPEANHTTISESR